MFKITAVGKLTTLHSFQYTDGQGPLAPLLQAANGAFYGTTFEGGNVGFEGCSGGCGTLFKIASGGAFATVHKFDFVDGGGLFSGLIQGTDGNLYGESPDGGAFRGSEIFELTLPRTLSTVYSFNPAVGSGGSTALVQGTGGKFYGTFGNPGAVFSFDMGLAPSVAFVIPAGKTGQSAQILGQDLTGATGVTFNGTQATSFRVVSDTHS